VGLRLDVAVRGARVAWTAGVKTVMLRRAGVG
jgi:hypothetical protein